MGRNVAIHWFLVAAILLLSTTFADAETSFKEMFTDPADGAFDMSRFIKTRTGFVPILAPVTEPAVGYGIAGGLVFFHRKEGEQSPDPPPAGEGRMTPPSLTAVGGFATENGSRGVFGGHRGVWKEDRIRYLGGLGRIPAAYVLRDPPPDKRHLPRRRNPDRPVHPGSRRTDPRE